MTEIILAEFQGKTWLVGGERYIDNLLINTLSPDISIRFIACESESDVIDLWTSHDRAPGAEGRPWLINPLIVDRIKGASGETVIVFTPWSVLLDDSAHSVLRAAAALAAGDLQKTLVLLAHADAEEAKIMADLTQLRFGLIEAVLTGMGVAQTRIAREIGGDGQVGGLKPDRIVIESRIL